MKKRGAFLRFGFRTDKTGIFEQLIYKNDHFAKTG